MAVMDRLEQRLWKDRVRYEFFDHPVAHSAQRTAQAEHVPGSKEAKVVVLRADGCNWMAALPATHHVDLLKLKNLLEVQDVAFEDEREFERLFPDCETGAMPPYGHLYGMPVVVDRALAAAGHIVFNAGSHTEAIRMTYDDYLKTANPLVGDFAVRTR